MFKVALSMYRVWITKEKVVKLRSIYIKCFKFVLSSMYSLWITKQEVLKLRSLYIKCLKLRGICMECGSLKKKL